jgi:hypothetical protein
MVNNTPAINNNKDNTAKDNNNISSSKKKNRSARRTNVKKHQQNSQQQQRTQQSTSNDDRVTINSPSDTSSLEGVFIPGSVTPDATKQQHPATHDHTPLLLNFPSTLERFSRAQVKPNNNTWRNMVVDTFNDRFQTSNNDDLKSFSEDDLYSQILESLDSSYFRTPEELQGRVNELLFKHKSTIRSLPNEFNFIKDIKSPGYKKLLEIHNILFSLQRWILKSPFNLSNQLEVIELSALLNEISMIFIKEGVEANSFESASMFIEPFLTTTNLVTLTEKFREKARKKVDKKKTSAVINEVAKTGITKQHKWSNRGNSNNRNGFNNNYNNNYNNNGGNKNNYQGKNQPFQRRPYNNNNNNNNISSNNAGGSNNNNNSNNNL